MNGQKIIGIEYYSAIKKNKNAICSNMDGPRDCHTEQSKSDRERQNITWYHFYMESKKKIVQIYKIEVEPQM